jgi:hypothetical protein
MFCASAVKEDVSGAWETSCGAELGPSASIACSCCMGAAAAGADLGWLILWHWERVEGSVGHGQLGDAAGPFVLGVPAPVLLSHPSHSSCALL